VQELVNELAGIVGDNPITSDELDLAVNNQTLTLPGLWETNDAVLTSIFEMEQFGLPDDHFDTLADRINGLTLEQLNEAARSMIQPKQVIWIVVGDKQSIEEGMRDLELGPVYEIDADGNIIG
jgi:zinc protease